MTASPGRCLNGPCGRPRPLTEALGGPQAASLQPHPQPVPVVPGQHLGGHVHGHEFSELNLCHFFEPVHAWVLDDGPDEGILLPASGEDDHLDQLPWPEGLDDLCKGRCHILFQT